MLSESDLTLVRPHLVPVEMPLRMVLEKPNRPITDVYFPEAGVVSVVVSDAHGREAEAGIIGCDGVTGHSVIAGDGQSPMSMYMQIAGRGVRIRADDLRSQINASPSLRSALKHYMSSFLSQTTYTVLANSLARIDKRLARWLLMAHDRTQGDSLFITHEFLSIMLGVRRPGVTESLHKLVSRGFIATERSTIHVLDREGMINFAEGFYGRSEAEQTRLTGWQPARAQ